MFKLVGRLVNNAGCVRQSSLLVPISSD